MVTAGGRGGDALVSYSPICFPYPQWQSHKSLRKLTLPSFLLVFGWRFREHNNLTLGQSRIELHYENVLRDEFKKKSSLPKNIRHNSDPVVLGNSS